MALSLVDEEEREKRAGNNGNPGNGGDAEGGATGLLSVISRAKVLERKVEACEKAAKDVRFEIFGDSLFGSLKGK